MLPEFASYPLGLNAVIFAAAAAVVWAAGTRIVRYAERIRERTGLGEAVLGLVLLGGVTSLPELAVSASSAYSGNASLAVNNLFGGVAMQVAILALADAAIGRDALTSVAASPGVMLQGTLNIVLLATAATGTIAGGTLLFGIGLWSWAVLMLYGLSVWILVRGRERSPPATGPSRGAARDERRLKAQVEWPLPGTLAKTGLAAALIFAAGYVLSRTGESIATQTGLGSSFIGAALVAISTSLPEVSTAVAAARLHRYEMAISDILGTNLIDVALVFVADAVYVGGAVLAGAGRSATVAALLGILLTAIYLAGLVERRDRVILRMGLDSAAVLLLYLAGLALLYHLRDAGTPG